MGVLRRVSHGPCSTLNSRHLASTCCSDAHKNNRRLKTYDLKGTAQCRAPRSAHGRPRQQALPVGVAQRLLEEEAATYCCAEGIGVLLLSLQIQLFHLIHDAATHKRFSGLEDNCLALGGQEGWRPEPSPCAEWCVGGTCLHETQPSALQQKYQLQNSSAFMATPQQTIQPWALDQAVIYVSLRGSVSVERSCVCVCVCV